MGVADRREREKEQRRNQIVDAAEQLFKSNGVNGTSMDDIARVTELSKGTLYLYFKSKEELYVAIVIRGMRLLSELFARALSEDCCGLKKLHQMGAVLLDYSHKYPLYFEAVFYHNLAIPDFHFETHPMSSELEQLGQEMYQQSCRVIELGIADGSMRPGIDVHKTAMSMYAVITGLIRVVNLEAEHLLHCHQISPEELVEYSFDLIKHALQSPEMAKEGCVKDCSSHKLKLKPQSGATAGTKKKPVS